MCSSSGTYLWYSSSLCTDSAKTLLAPLRVRRVAPALELCAGKENSHLLIRIIQERPYTGRHHHLGAIRRTGRRQVGAKGAPAGARGAPAGAGTYFLLPMPQALGVGSSWCVSSPVF